MSEETLTQAVQLIKDGEKQKAQKILSQYLADNRESEQGWLLLTLCMENEEKKRFCLNKALEINPNNKLALNMVAKLDEDSGSYPPIDKLVSPKDATLQVPFWAMDDDTPLEFSMGAGGRSVPPFREMSPEPVRTERSPEPDRPRRKEAAKESGWEEVEKEDPDAEFKKPRPVFNILIAIAMTIGAAAAVFFLGHGTDITCERVDPEAVDCELAPHVLGLVYLGTESVEYVYAASVEEDCEDNCVYRVVLDAVGGSEPVSPYLTPGYAQYQETAHRINAMIADPGQQTVSIADPPGVFQWAVFAAAVLIGVLVPWASALFQVGKWVLAG
jgi:hypothetical protein